MTTIPISQVLLPCPHCGTANPLETALTYAHSINCEACLTALSACSREEAVDWWNRRASQVAGEPVEPVAQGFEVFTRPCAVSGEDELQNTVHFKVGVQSFRLDYVGNDEETAFMKNQLAIALSRIASPQPADQQDKEQS